MKTTRHPGGFTLVEVVMAMGVFVFGVMAVVGLLPTGLKSWKESAGQVAEENIVQQIASDAQLTGFSNLSRRTVYFDNEGMKVDSESGSIYTVTSEVIKSAAIPTTTTPAPSSAPGSGTSTWADMALMQITIKPVSGPAAQRFIHIANLEKN